MARFTGRQNSIGLRKEAVRGTTGASADYWLPYVNYSFNEKVEKVRDESGLGVLSTPAGSDIVREWSEGELTFNVRDQSVGLILLGLFGTETFATSTPVTGVGRHTFTLAVSNQHQSLSIYKKDAIETLQAGNVVVSSMGLNVVLDQYMQMTVGLMGKKFGTDTATVAYVAENKFRPQDATVKIAATANELAAAGAITTLRSLSLNFNKNVEVYQGLGSKTPVDFLNKDFEVSGDMELLMEDATYKNLVLNSNANRAMSIKFLNANAIAALTTNPSLEFIFDELDFGEFTPDYENGNLVTISLSFTAHYNFANSRMCRAILENSKNAAY